MERLVEARKGPGPPAKYKGKPPRAPLSPLKGFLILICVVIAAFLCSLAISMVGGVILLPMQIIMVVIIPFLLGMLVEKKWSWALGLSYAFLYLFWLFPWRFWGEWGHSYMWLSTADKGIAHFSWIFIVMVVCLLFSFLGSIAFRKRKLIRVNLEKPAQTIVPVVTLSVFLAVLAPFAMNFVKGEKAEILSYPEYGFQILKPKGWFYYPGGSNDMSKENAENCIALHSYSGTPNGGRVEIFIYRNMPFTGVPLEGFKSADEAHENLLAVLEDVKRNPSKYLFRSVLDGRLRAQDFADFQYYGKTTIGRSEAIRLAYGEYGVDYDQWGQPITGWKPSYPQTSKYGDIVVYREPYLYWLEMPSNPKIYKEIKDSFKFI